MNGSPDTARAWTALASRLADCGRALQAELAPALAAVDLSESDFSLLWLLHQSAPQGISAQDGLRGAWHQRLLAERLDVSPGHVCAVVERLRERGLVHSRRLDADRRRQCWEISSAGEQVLAELHSRLAVWAAARETGFGGPNRAALTKLLDHLAGCCRKSTADDQSGKEAA